jgi:hypothetical protein
MHAHTEQLLSLRDGEPIDVQVARHVAECPSCLLELDRLKQMQVHLRALASRQAPPPAWASVQAGIDRSPAAERMGAWRRLAPAVAAAGFIAILLLVALRFTGTEQQARHVDEPATPAPALVETPPMAVATVDQLVAQSRQLEDVLRNMPEPRVERVALAATTDIIEQRIQWLDFQLSFEPEVQLSQEQARSLWLERVDLMGSLVKVRYAQVQGLAF